MEIKPLMFFDVSALIEKLQQLDGKMPVYLEVCDNGLTPGRWKGDIQVIEDVDREKRNYIVITDLEEQ